MRLSRLLGLGILALAAAPTSAQVIIGVAVGRSHADNSNPQPFYLEQTSGSLSSDTGVWSAARSQWTIARQPDGTTVRSESRGPDADHRLRLHDIFFPDGRVVSLFEGVKAKTSWPASAHFGLGRIRDESAGCNRNELDDQGQPAEQVGGLQSVEGQLVVVNTLISGELRDGERRIVSWRAPALACEELYYRVEKLQDGAAPIVTAEIKTTKLVLGDPGPQLFTIPADYVEMKPSEALMKAVLGTGVPIPDEERQRIIKEGEDLDRRYRAEK